MNQSNLEQVQNIFVSAREQLLREILNAAQSGSTARASNYAPQLVNLSNAINSVDNLLAEFDEQAPAEEGSAETPAERMARVRAARKKQ